MRVSLTEIETSVKNASCSVGLEFGLAEDAGKTARYMIENNLAPLKQFLEAIDRIENNTSASFKVEMAAEGKFVSDSAKKGLSALIVGASVSDLILLDIDHIKSQSLNIYNIDKPAIIIFYILASLYRQKKHSCFSWTIGESNRVSGVCFGGELAVRRNSYQKVLKADSTNISIRPINYHSKYIKQIINFRRQNIVPEVDINVWDKLSNYCERLLVEGSEKSRLSGAGAGIIDSD